MQQRGQYFALTVIIVIISLVIAGGYLANEFFMKPNAIFESAGFISKSAGEVRERADGSIFSKETREVK